MIPKDRILEKLDSLFRTNDTSGAKRLLEYWLSEAEYTRDGHGILLMENELMGLYRKLGEENQAMHYAQRALEQIEKMGIGDRVGAATTYLNCATVKKAFGYAKEALALYRRAQVIYERELEPSDDRLAGLYNNMALALVDLECYREAEALYQRALEILESVPESEPERAITYLNLATASETERGKEGAKDEIAALCERARLCLDKGKDRTDGGYAFVCEKCASVFGFYGFEDYAKELAERARRIYEGA